MLTKNWYLTNYYVRKFQMNRVTDRFPKVSNTLLSSTELQLFSLILRESVLPEALYKPYKKLRQELPISENEVERTIALAIHNDLLRQDSAGYIHYPEQTFATLLQQLQSCFREKLPNIPYGTDTYEIFTNDFFQASLYHVQRILHIVQRRDKRLLNNKLARIELIRLLSRMWLTVFERFPAIDTTSLPLLQVYFLLRDGNSQFELSYFIEQLQKTPYCLQLLSLFGIDLDSSDVNFPFEVLSFARTIGLNVPDTSIFWMAISDLMAFLATTDERVKIRYNLLQKDFVHTANLLFLPIKGDEMMVSLTGALYSNDVEFPIGEGSPLEEIAAIRKELTKAIEQIPMNGRQQFPFHPLFVFIGHPGRGQRDSARILRHQFAQIVAWPYQQGYYEWDVQKRLNYPIGDLEKILKQYEKGCIYFHNFPPLLSPCTIDENLQTFLALLRANLRYRMLIFDFASLSQVQHYLPELETTEVFVVRFNSYTITHLQHHFRQLAVISEIDVSAESYYFLRDLYEKAKPFFDKGVYADQFVYQLFAESLRNMSFRIKEGFTSSGTLQNSEIIPDDLLKAFHLLLHL